MSEKQVYVYLEVFSPRIGVKMDGEEDLIKDVLSKYKVVAIIGLSRNHKRTAIGLPST